MSFAFDETYYLKSKLQQLIKTDATTYGAWSTDQVKQAIQDAGMTVEQHYQQYSLVEGTSANPYFNTTEYLEAKLAQLKSIDSAQYGNWSVADVVKAFQDAGFTSAEDHYNQYGCHEVDAGGKLINPSNAFDANAYVEAKLAQLKATDPENWSDKTAQDVVEAFEDAGLSPVEHYEEYGKAEGQAAGIAMVQTVPVVERVANDPARDAMGENVPSNYNAATPAPKNVSSDDAAGVAKPCDMATAAKPADPVAVPGDSAYVAVPGGGIEDTNANPVELVTATVTDDKGNVIGSESQYGVASTKTENGVTTKTVQPVNSDGTVDAEAAPIQTVTTDTAKGTTTTETKLTDSEGNTLEVKEEVVKNNDGSTTTTTTATETDKNDKVVAQTATVTEADASGAETGSTSTYTDANGNTSTTESGDAPEPAPTPEPTPTPTPGGGGSGASAGATPSVSGITVNDAGKIEVTFSEKMFAKNGLTVNEVSYAIGDGADTHPAALTDMVLSADGKTLTITPATTLAAGDTVSVKIAEGAYVSGYNVALPETTTDTYLIPIEENPDESIGLTVALDTDKLVVTGVDADAEVTANITAAAGTSASLAVSGGKTVDTAINDLTNITIAAASGIDVAGAQAKSVTVTNTAGVDMTAAVTVKAGVSTPVTVTMSANTDQYAIESGSTTQTTVDASTNAMANGEVLSGTFTLKTASGSATVEAGKIAVGASDATLGAATAGGSATFSGSLKGLPVADVTLKVTDGDTVDISGATLNSEVVSFALSTTGSASTVTMTGSQFAAFTGGSSTAIATEADDTIILTSAMTGDETIATLTTAFTGTLKGTGDLHVSGTSVDFSGAKALEGFTGIVLSQSTPESTTVKLTAAELYSLGKVVADNATGGIQDVVELSDALNSLSVVGETTGTADTYTLASTVSNQVQIKLANAADNLVACSTNGSNIDASGVGSNTAKINLNAGADTVKLGGTGNDVITISALNSAEASAADAISAFDGDSKDTVVFAKDLGFTKATANSGALPTGAATTNTIYNVTPGSQLDAAGVAALFGDGKATVTGGEKILLVENAATDSAYANVWLVTNDADSDAIADTEVQLIASLAGSKIDFGDFSVEA